MKLYEKMLNKSENVLDMRKSDVYQRIAHHINVKSQENTSGIVRNKLSSDSKSERDGRKLWEKNLFRMCFCICMEYIYYAGCLIKSKRKYRKVQPSLWMCVFAQQCPDRKKRQRDKKIQREKNEQAWKKFYCLRHSLYFPAIKCYECHRIQAISCDVRCVCMQHCDSCLCQKHIFSSSFSFLYYSQFYHFFCFGRVHSAHCTNHTAHTHMLFSWMFFSMKWQETKMRYSFVTVDDTGGFVVFSWKRRSHSHIMWMCLCCSHSVRFYVSSITQKSSSKWVNHRNKHCDCEHE